MNAIFLTANNGLKFSVDNGLVKLHHFFVYSKSYHINYDKIGRVIINIMICKILINSEILNWLKNIFVIL